MDVTFSYSAMIALEESISVQQHDIGFDVGADL